MATCEYCGKQFYPGDGLWDDGDYMCGECLAKHIEQAKHREKTQNKLQPQPQIKNKK